MTSSGGELSIITLLLAQSYKNCQTPPVAKKTMFAGFRPTRKPGKRRRHLVAVVAFDGVVLGDLSTPCEIFGWARGTDGRPLYKVRVCSVGAEVTSRHVTLKVPWR